MADTHTANYGFTKPEPGTAGWDGKLNADMDAIDTEIQNRADEIAMKATKPANPMANNLATLDGNGNLIDSGKPSGMVVGAFYAHEASPSDMTIVIEAGRLMASGSLVEMGQQVTTAITAPTTNPRIDRIVIDEQTGIYAIVQGDEAASPVAPPIPSGTLPVCQFQLETNTAAITNSIIVNKRPAYIKQRLDAKNLPWYDTGYEATNINTIQFSVAGDVTGEFVLRRRIKITDSGVVTGNISSSGYSAPNTTITITPDPGSPLLSGTITKVELGGITSGNPSAQMYVKHEFISLPTYVSSTSIIPLDGTVPQITEGTEILSYSPTVEYSDSYIRVQIVVPVESATFGTITPEGATVALFKNGAADAIASAVVYIPQGKTYVGGVAILQWEGGVAGGDVFTVRFGPEGSNAVAVGQNSSNLYSIAADIYVGS